MKNDDPLDRAPRLPWWAWLSPFWWALVRDDIEARLEQASRRKDPKWWADYDAMRGQRHE